MATATVDKPKTTTKKENKVDNTPKPAPQANDGASASKGKVRITGGRLDRIDALLGSLVEDHGKLLEAIDELLAGKEDSRSPVVADLRSVRDKLASDFGDIAKTERLAIAQIKLDVEDML